MVMSVFKGVVDVPIRAAIIGYPYRSATWEFARGNPWPIYAATNYDPTSPVKVQVLGGVCDVFDLNSAGVGRYTLNDFGTLVPGSYPNGSFLPGWWNGQIMGVNGGAYTFGTPDAAFVAPYNLPAPAGTAKSYPTFPQGPDIAGINDTALVTSHWVTATHMQTLGVVSTFFGSGGVTNIARSNNTTLGGVIGNVAGSPIYNGIIPGTGYYISTNILAPFSRLGYYNGVSIVEVPINWDNATIDATLQAVGGFGDNARTTMAGWTYYYNGSVTIAGVTYTNFIVLTAFDGSWWKILNLRAADAFAAVALGAGG